MPVTGQRAMHFPCALCAGTDGIGGADEYGLHTSLIFLFAQSMELLTYPVGDVFGQVMDEREAMRVRAEKDMVYRNLLQEYGISFKKRGRSNGIQDEGRGQD